ncbi:MAG: fused MFS/spermidine synthase [Thermodesulfobacteriota bacterium]
MDMTTENSKNFNKVIIVLALFFITGLTGLAYELVWIRLLILVFGSTQFAFTTVLTTFMAGLALGSLIFGRIVDRSENPLKIYAFIEIGIGVYCLISPFVFDLVRDVYLGAFAGTYAASTDAGFNVSQFMLTFIALIIPTTLMGGTLPVIVKYLSEVKKEVGFNTALAYSINTLGAVTGCLVTGLFGLYFIGVKTSIYAAGIIDIIVGLILFSLFKGASGVSKARGDDADRGVMEPIPVSTAITGIEHGTLPAYIVIGSFALSGFASLVYEVLWTRVLSLIIGSSVYAFTIMLATFLFGIGAGSIIFAPFIDRRKNPLLWFAAFEAIIAFASIVSIFLYKEFPFIFYGMQESFGERFYLFLIVQFLLCSALMIIPTLSMGAIFPLVGKIYTQSIRTVGRNIGDVYFFNTAGSIFGAFIGGFFLMPLLGVQRAVVLIAGLNIIIAIALVSISGVTKIKKIAISVVAVILFIVSTQALPPWDKLLMTLGLYSNVYTESAMDEFKEGAFGEKLVYYKEGINAIITVRTAGKDGREITYQANGKQEARAFGSKPAETWSLLGHVPVLLHNIPPKNALLVGLGSGITLGSMLSYPIPDIDVVELEPAVMEAAKYFKESNNNALSDPRAHIHITDGRNFVFTSEKNYDLIVSAVSDPWISGVSNLFTREYFEKMKERLSDGGIAALWFQNYRIRSEELKVGLATFASVFPNVSIWFYYKNSSDLIVIGSVEEHAFDLETLAKWLSVEEVQRDLARIEIRSPYNILDLFLIGNNDLREYMGEAPLNTDERPILEFSLPKLLYMDPAKSVELLSEVLDAAKDVVPPIRIPDNWSVKDRESFYLTLADTYNQSNFRLAQALKVYNIVLEINPDNTRAQEQVERLKRELGVSMH